MEFRQTTKMTSQIFTGKMDFGEDCQMGRSPILELFVNDDCFDYPCNKNDCNKINDKSIKKKKKKGNCTKLRKK